MENASAQGNGQADTAAAVPDQLPDQPRVMRDMLPIPDVHHVGLTTARSRRRAHRVDNL